MSDSEDLFNFIPLEQPTFQQKPGEKTLGLVRKRTKTDKIVYQYVKKPVGGAVKIIKIEIYDANAYPKSEQSICNCEADVCVQHVVKSTLYDDIYTSAKELISKIQDDLQL